jgi:hypothetical protein
MFVTFDADDPSMGRVGDPSSTRYRDCVMNSNRTSTVEQPCRNSSEILMTMSGKAEEVETLRRPFVGLFAGQCVVARH